MSKLLQLLPTREQLICLFEQHIADEQTFVLKKRIMARDRYISLWQQQLLMNKKIGAVQNDMELSWSTVMLSSSSIVKSCIRSDGVTITDLADSRDEDEIDESSQSLTALFVQGAWQVGLLIKIPAGSIVKEPIDIADYVTISNGAITKIVIMLGADAQATFIDSRIVNQSFLASSITYHLGNRARALVRHECSWQLFCGIMHICAELAIDSYFELQAVIAGGQRLGYDVEIFCNGVRSQAKVQSAIIGQQKQLIIMQSSQIHRGAYTISKLEMRGLCAHGAQLHFDGMVHVAPSANGADAQQQSRFLVIGDTAHAHAKPVLEALTDDIRCSHGSAVGQLDEEQLTYLRLRGIAMPVARQMLTQGFLYEVVDVHAQPFLHTVIKSVFNEFI